MSRDLASIQKITAIEPIKGKDRIVYATIQGWHVIVGKDDFKVGDLVIYVQYDTVLPVCGEFEFLRPRCYSSKYDGFRIRNMKMAGVYSEGIVFPLEILSDNLPIESLDEGFDVSEILDVQRYDPELLKEVEKAKNSKNPIYKWLMRYKWFRKFVMSRKPSGGYPETIHKSDEKNIQTQFGRLKDKNIPFYLTEKLEGQSATYEVTKKGKFRVYSHNVFLNKPGNSTWGRIAVKFNIEKLMKRYMKEWKIKSLAIQGEIIGPGIQRNIYKLDDLDFYIFNVRDTDLQLDFDLNNLQVFEADTKIKIVPMLSYNHYMFETSDEILKNADGYSVLNSNTRREGIVWRAHHASGKLSFKAKSKIYEDLWNKKDKTE